MSVARKAVLFIATKTFHQIALRTKQRRKTCLPRMKKINKGYKRKREKGNEFKSMKMNLTQFNDETINCLFQENVLKRVDEKGKGKYITIEVHRGAAVLPCKSLDMHACIYCMYMYSIDYRCYM